MDNLATKSCIRQYPTLLLAMAWLGFCLLAAPATADTWGAPEIQEFTSSDGKYVARVLPKWPPQENMPSANLAVFEVRGNERKPHWTCQLINKVAPQRVLITNNGERVVTVDNWSGLGDGDDFLAFYDRTGPLEQYSLEEAFSEIFGPQESRLERQIQNWMDGVSQQSVLQPMVRFYQSHFQRRRPQPWDFFGRTVSSWLWQEHSIDFLESTNDSVHWGIWLDWAHRWFVWDTQDGKKVRIKGKTLQHWNHKGLQWARLQLQPTESNRRPSQNEFRSWSDEKKLQWRREKANQHRNQVTACRYLAYVHKPQDRALLNHALESMEETVNWIVELRINADRALAIQDGIHADFKTLDYLSRKRAYSGYLLGNLNVRILFPENFDQGQLYISLFSAKIAHDNWRDAKPVCRTGKGFIDTNQEPLGLVFERHMPPLLPGKYWVKAVWNRTPPFDYPLQWHRGMSEWKLSEGPAPAAGPGDFESNTRTVVEIKAGETHSVAIQLEPYREN